LKEKLYGNKIHQYQQNKHISFQMIEKKTTTYVDGNPVPGLGLVQTCIRQYIEEWDHHPLPS
jgi:hypothetical protein